MPADTAVILLVPLLYGIECVRWARSGTTYFSTLLGKRWKVRRPFKPAEGSDAGPLVLFPLPPLGIAAPAHLPRIAFSPEGLSSYVPETEDAPDESGPRHYLYAEVETAAARDREIFINGRPFVRARSKEAARETAEFIKTLKKARPRDREELIVRRIDGLFKRSGIAAGLEAFLGRTTDLLILCNSLWLYVVVGVPVILFFYGLSRVILPFLGAALLLHLVITGMAFVKHKTLFGRYDLSMLYTVLPSPFNSIRAVDHLAKELFAASHPVAVASTLLSKERFASFARPALARLRHPVYGDKAPDAAVAIDRWFKERLLARAAACVEAAGLDPAGLAVPEASADDGLYRAFCPRCLCCFQQEAGECPDCPGIALVRRP